MARPAFNIQGVELREVSVHSESQDPAVTSLHYSSPRKRQQKWKLGSTQEEKSSPLTPVHGTLTLDQKTQEMLDVTFLNTP